MIPFRVFITVTISLLLLTLTGYAQESSSADKSQTKDAPSKIERNFHKVPVGKDKKIFHEAVTGHIVSNKGIQDFYAETTAAGWQIGEVPDLESSSAILYGVP